MAIYIKKTRLLLRQCSSRNVQNTDPETLPVMCVKLFKNQTASLGAHLDYGENRIEGVWGCWIELKSGSRSGVEAHTLTHTHKKKSGWVSGTF